MERRPSLMKCFVGLDVSSTKLDVCIMLSDTSTPVTASLSNDLSGATEIKNHILDLNHTYHFERIVIGMEATSLYSFHPAMFFHEDSQLKELHVEIMVEQPVEQPNKIKKYREAFEENKNDTIDAFYIADYFRIERFSPSFLKEEKYMALQHLTRTRLQIIEQLTRTKQHFIENIYYKCNTLAYQFKKKGLKVVLGAADTFRAAAIDQLQVWAERVGVPLVKQQTGSDPASVAYDTLSSALSQGADVVIIDTAGRLHNKVNLMNELSKVKRVMQKLLPETPDEILLVLDGSTGQNAFEQAKQFTLATEVNALAITKLDGTAKGGVVIGISDQFQIPVKYIGVGEGIEDLQVFNKYEFVDSFFK